MIESDIRVLLIDDHPTVLLGLQCVLDGAPGIQVVGAERDGERGLTTFLTSRPDVVVLDLSMPGQSGHEVMQRMLTLVPEAIVLILTSSLDEETVSAALRAGAAGYVLKDTDSSELVRAVRASARGELPIDAKVTRFLLAAPATVDASGLTPRECDVLRLVQLGLANKQIAARLGIGETTVKTHLSSAYQRIGVTDRTSAALWANSHLEKVAAH
jgi:DNA-binding NarL/FixJ family response regulator